MSQVRIRCLKNILKNIENICRKCIEVIKLAQYLPIRQADEMLVSFSLELKYCLHFQKDLSGVRTGETNISIRDVHDFVVTELLQSPEVLLTELPLLFVKMGEVRDQVGFIPEEVDQLFSQSCERAIETLSQGYTVVLVDLHAYGQLEDSLGTIRATEVSRLILNEINRDIIRKYDGTGKIRFTDSIYSSFQDQEKAVNCAIDIQRFAETGISNWIRQRAGGFPFKFTITIDTGEEIFMVDGEPIGGKGVTPIARIAAVTYPEQILISDKVYEKVVQHLDYKCAGPYRFNSAKRQYQVYEVLWKNGMETKGLKLGGKIVGCD